MNRAIFLVDSEPGHLLATFGLANFLKRNGLDVCYVTSSTGAALVRLHGFRIAHLLPEEDHGNVPKGEADYLRETLGSLVDSAPFLEVLRDFAPGIVVTLSLFPLIGLAVSTRLNVPLLFVRNTFWGGARSAFVRQVLTHQMRGLSPSLLAESVASNSLEHLEARVLRSTELVLLPPSCRPTSASPSDLSVYVGPFLLPAPGEDSLGEAPESHKPLLFCSFGSQGLHDSSPALPVIQDFIDAVSQSHFAALIAVRTTSGRLLRTEHPDIEVVEWAPQPLVLQRASLMLNHAGIGTLRECFAAGVPVLAVPLGRDQLDAARYFKSRSLLEVLSSGRSSPAAVFSAIEALINSNDVRNALQKARSEFKFDDQSRVLEAVRMLICECQGVIS